RNDFVQYRHYAEESVRRAAEMLGTQHMRYGESLNNLNTLFYELGDYSKSIALLEQSLQVQEQNQEHPVEMAFSYHNIGKVYRKKGDYPKALSYLKRALEFRLDSLGRIDYNIAKTFFDMGQVYADLERRDTARQYFTDCLDILGQLPSKNKRIYKRVVACHHALAELCLAEGELRTAFQYVDKALALEKEKGTLGRQSYSYELLGEIYQQQKRHSKAIAAFEKAIDISQDSYKDFSWPSQARTIKKMALALAASGQSKAALLQLQLALHKLSPTSPATEDFAQNPAASQLLAPALALDIIHQKAKLCRWLYQKNGSLDWLDAAHANYLAAARLSRHLRQSVQTSEGKIMLAANSLPLFEGGIQTAFQLYQHRQDRQYIQQAFQLIEANKAALLLDALLEESARGLGHIPDSLLQQEKRLSLERTFYQKKILSQKADSATVKKWEDQLFELSRQHERLVQQLETQFPLYHQAKYDRSPIDIDDLQQQETFRNSCLINYFVGDSSSFALAIGPEQLYFYQIEQASSHLEQVHHFHQSLSLPARRTLGPADY
ncbi:MAG: tetratricopeptide repeat protein, partial [Bacteroidota bacterium]